MACCPWLPQAFCITLPVMPPEPMFIMPMPMKAPAAPPVLLAASPIASIILPCCIIELELNS